MNSSCPSAKIWSPYNKHSSNSSMMRLFCFTYAGGMAASYWSWIEKLKPEIDVWPIQLPGRERRLREKPYTSVEDIAGGFLNAMESHLYEKPYALFGHSLGAKVVYELTKSIQKAALPPPTQLIVSGCIAPHCADRSPRTQCLSKEQFIQEMRRLNGTPEDVLNNEELMNLILPYIRADYEASENYIWKDDLKINCPLVALGGTDDSDVSVEELNSWKLHAGNTFSSFLFPGGHFFIHNSESFLLEKIRETLNDLLTSVV